ncbi:uncharacterized protein LOC143247599 isoform X2 [Tachypleus tridentatus]
MPQEFRVLRCFNCETFQVHLVKKSMIWNCKMCGEKQSVKQVYGKGSGLDCRKHVQKLNSFRGQLLEETKEFLHVRGTETQSDSEDSELHYEKQLRVNSCSGQSQKSKWAIFLDDHSQESSSARDNTEIFRCATHQKKGVLLETKSSDSCHLITQRQNEESVSNPAKKIKFSKALNSEITNDLSTIQGDNIHYSTHLNDRHLEKTCSLNRTPNYDSLDDGSDHFNETHLTSNLKRSHNEAVKNSCNVSHLNNFKLDKEKTSEYTKQNDKALIKPSKWGTFLISDDEHEDTTFSFGQGNGFVTSTSNNWISRDTSNRWSASGDRETSLLSDSNSEIVESSFSLEFDF